LTPPSITLFPSRRLAAVLGAAHAGAMACLWVLAVPWPWKAAGTLALAASAAMVIARTALLRGGRAVIELRVGGGGVSYRTRDGAWHAGRLAPSSFVSPLLTIIGVEGDGRPRYVVIAPDSVEPEDFRRLRVWLKWGAPPAAGT
jgi:toxin CptA